MTQNFYKNFKLIENKTFGVSIIPLQYYCIIAMKINIHNLNELAIILTYAQEVFSSYQTWLVVIKTGIGYLVENDHKTK